MTDPNPAGLGARLRRYRLLAVVVALTLLADQASKSWIYGELAYGGYDRIVVIPGFLYLIHVGNTGAAWGLFPGSSMVLAALGLATIGAMAAWRHRLGIRVRGVQVAFGLLMGGILGNVIDRFAHGHVVDFLDVHLGFYIWPTFNLADSAICVGAGLYAWLSLFHPGLNGSAPAPAPSPSASPSESDHA